MGLSPRSRRAVLVPHLANRAKLRRCPICQLVIDTDHAEALAIEAAAVPARAGRTEDPARSTGFALVEPHRPEPRRAGLPEAAPRVRASAGSEVGEPEDVLESLLA